MSSIRLDIDALKCTHSLDSQDELLFITYFVDDLANSHAERTVVNASSGTTVPLRLVVFNHTYHDERPHTVRGHVTIFKVERNSVSSTAAGGIAGFAWAGLAYAWAFFFGLGPWGILIAFGFFGLGFIIGGILGSSVTQRRLGMLYFNHDLYPTWNDQTKQPDYQFFAAGYVSSFLLVSNYNYDFIVQQVEP